MASNSSQKNHLSPRKLPSNHFSLSDHLGLPFYLPIQTYEVFIGKFTDTVNFYLTAIDDWHSRQVLARGCVSLVCCYLELSFPRLCTHIISEFWNFVKHFLKLFFAVLNFLLLIRTLCAFLFRSSCLVATRTLYTCSIDMSSTFLKKVFKKILTHWL